MEELKNYIVSQGHRILHNGKRYVSYDIISLTEKEATRLGSKVKLNENVEPKKIEEPKQPIIESSIVEEIAEEITEKKSKKGVKE